MNTQRILVTGGTGFAGTHLIEELLSQGYQNIYATTYSKPDSSAQLLPPESYIRTDLTSVEATRALFSQVRPDWVFHLASFAYVGKSFEKAQELFSNNIMLQLNVLEAVREFVPSARILTIGSAEEYGMVPANSGPIDETTLLNPVNPYAVSKVTQDLLAGSYALTYKLQIIRARPFNHIGTGQTLDFAIPSFARQIVAVERGVQSAIRVGTLSAVRDFSSVQDMVRAYILLLEKGVVGEIYNIGSGTGVQIQTILEKMISYARTEIKIVTDPDKVRPLDAPGLIADNGKIRALGWQAVVPIETELQQVLEEWRTKIEREA